MDSIIQAVAVLTKTGDHRPEQENACAVITVAQTPLVAQRYPKWLLDPSVLFFNTALQNVMSYS